MKPTVKISSFIFLCLFLSACAGKPHNPNDPYEGYNRKMHAFNTAFDKAISKPVAKGYTTVVPPTVRQGFGNAFRNLGDARVAVVDVTQGQFLGALESVHRFVFNSTFGLLGFIDLTKPFNLPEKHTNDIGTTLAKMGWRNSNYFVIPFIGPSTPRDTWGAVGDIAASPHYYVLNHYQSIGLTAASFIQLRSELLDVDAITKQAALDPYTFQREAYMQYRANVLRERGVEVSSSSFVEDDEELSISELARQRHQGEASINTNTSDEETLSLKELAHKRNR